MSDLSNHSSISGWIKKLKHNEKQLPNKNDNDTRDREHEKLDKFLEMINCYNNIKNKK